VITANGGITATGQPITCGALTCTSETDTGALTAGGLITANGGLTVASGQTLTLTGATTVATTQAIGDNNTSIATTAYVNLYAGWTVLTYTTSGQNVTIPAQTSMNILIKYSCTVGTAGTVLTITPPPSANYIGQIYRVVNVSTTTSQVFIATSSGNVVGQGSQFLAGGQVGITKYLAYSWVYVGQTGIGWYLGY
jgi:hypothetical protein